MAANKKQYMIFCNPFTISQRALNFIISVEKMKHDNFKKTQVCEKVLHKKKEI